MLTHRITCDGCHYAMSHGRNGEKGHQFRRRLAADGWKQVDKHRRPDVNGKYDLCPMCWAKINKSDNR